MNKTSLGIGYMIISGLFFGGVWFFSKQVVQDIAPLTFTTLRMIAALTALSILGWKYVPKLSSISAQDRKRILLTTLIGMVCGSIFFTLSVKRTTVTNSSFLFFLPAALLPIRGALFSQLKIRLSTYLAVFLCILGLYFLFDPDIVGTSMVGNVLGLLAGITNVIYIISIKKLSHIPTKLLSIAVFVVLVLSLFLITAFIEGNQLSQIALGSWQTIGYIGLCIGGAYFFMNSALQYISSYLASIHAIREPLAATALGVLFLGEILTTSATLGLGSILIGFILISVDKGLME